MRMPIETCEALGALSGLDQYVKRTALLDFFQLSLKRSIAKHYKLTALLTEENSDFPDCAMQKAL